MGRRAASENGAAPRRNKFEHPRDRIVEADFEAAGKETSDMLEVKDLCKSFGPFRAVDGISFTVGKGEILGFLGPNGAGKSTTMRMITGYLTPDSGTAVICGNDIRENGTAAKRLLGYLPENAPVYGEMSVTDFLNFVAGIRGYRGAEAKSRVADTIERCRLDKVQHQLIETLSKGYRQRVCFAQAVLHDPSLLIMDEPTDGLDPNQKFLVRNMIRDMAREKAIVISTHILEEVEAICTRAIIISGGKIVASGTPEELKGRSPTGRLEDVFRTLTLGAGETAKAG
jgi:ABC-2 type transport system ATP-binding protein